MNQSGNTLLTTAERRESGAIWFLGVLALVFLALSLVANHSRMLKFDNAITSILQAERNPVSDIAAKAATLFGSTPAITIAAVVAAFIASAKARPVACWLILATLISVPLNILLKEIVGRPRPTQDAVQVLLPAIGLSFPSGHAMLSIVVYGFIAVVVWTHSRNRRLRWILSILLVALALAPGVSRIYLGVHWFSDVIGGWTAGAFLVLLLAELYKFIGKRELKYEERNPKAA